MSPSASPTRMTPEEELMDTFEFPRTSTPPIPNIKKARRQTAYYPNMNSGNKLQKPFSRSAAKRESVMALGSIEHLQHYFTKTGIASKDNPLQKKGYVPVIGGPAHRPTKSFFGGVQEFALPPSPAIPTFTRPPYPRIEKSYELDPENLKPGVIEDLESVSTAWGLSSDRDDNRLVVGKGKSKVTDEFDVLSTLKRTTHLIRSVRNYLVSLPDDAGIPEAEKAQFRPRTFSPAPMKRVVSSSSPASDPLSRIRRSALDVLTVLRALEESSRLPLTDDAYDAQSDHTSSQDAGELHSPSHLHTKLAEEHDHDASFSISVVSIAGRSAAVAVWDDEDTDDHFRNDEENEKREIWDERLVLGGGWLYRQDIRLSNLTKERSVIGKYLDIVDELLFGGPSEDGHRGWQRAAHERTKSDRELKAKGRRTSLGNPRDDASPDLRSELEGSGALEAMRDMVIAEEELAGDHDDSVDEDDLPEWAKRSSYTHDALARCHALLLALLPSSLLELLPAPYASRIDLLTALSSGQLLCAAYNTGVRRSRKPWGYINRDSVHDVAALEAKAETEDTDGGHTENGDAAEKRQKGWTFRRIDNLRLWAAALKLRYLIPLMTPVLPSVISNGNSPSTPTASPGPTKTRFGRYAEPPIVFDAKVIARMEEGWESMLETAILRWVQCVVEERRGGR